MAFIVQGDPPAEEQAAAERAAPDPPPGLGPGARGTSG
jgi:hypothetical protein